MRRSGLSRHIIVSMSLMVVGVIVMMILSSWLLYAVLVEFFPGSTDEPQGWLPTGPELAWMAGVILTGLALAIVASFRLAHRILSPLNSLVDSVRALARGDLGAHETRRSGRTPARIRRGDRGGPRELLLLSGHRRSGSGVNHGD